MIVICAGLPTVYALDRYVTKWRSSPTTNDTPISDSHKALGTKEWKKNSDSLMCGIPKNNKYEKSISDIAIKQLSNPNGTKWRIP